MLHCECPRFSSSRLANKASSASALARVRRAGLSTVAHAAAAAHALDAPVLPTPAADAVGSSHKSAVASFRQLGEVAAKKRKRSPPDRLSPSQTASCPVLITQELPYTSATRDC